MFIHRLLAPLFGSRRTWCEDGLALIEVHGLDDPGGQRLGSQVRERLELLAGVSWAEAQHGTGRVGVAFDPDSIPLGALVAEVEAAEASVAAPPPPLRREGDHPADVQPLVRAATALAADAAGLGLSALGRLTRRSPIPLEAAALVTVVQNTPALRRGVERAVGLPVAEVGLALANATAQALVQGQTSLAVDAVSQAQHIAEIRSRRRVWSEQAPELLGRSTDEPAEPLPPEHAERPVPLPPGPIETAAVRLSSGGLLGGAAALAGTRQTRTATNVVLAGVAKAGRLGRESFAAQLGIALARRGIVPLDPSVLRRLDRVDTVIVDAALLRGPRPLSSSGRPASEPRQAPDVAALLAALDDTALDIRVVGGGLVEAVRAAQRDGAVVAVVTETATAALAAADCGIGVVPDRGAVPWTADLLGGVEDAAFTLTAVGPAHTVSRRSALLAVGGSGIGVFVAFLGPRRSASTRVSATINGVAAVSMVAGSWSAIAHTRRFVPPAADPTPWHELSAEVALRELGSSHAGLTPAEADERHAANGAGTAGGGLFAWVRPFAEEVVNPLTPVLALGAGLSAAAGSVVDASIVTGLIGLNAAVGGLQRLRTEREIAALLEATSHPVRVRRDGAELTVEVTDLAVGDLVLYEQGHVVAGDARVLEASALEVDESNLTGESLPVAKHAEPCAAPAVADRRCMLYDGTTISAGRAEAVVVATGPGTEAGRSLASADVQPPATGVERRLAQLTSRILPVAVGAGAAVTAAGLLQGWPRPDIVGSGVSLAVASVPEGLPFVANVAQLAASRRLAARHALVRNPRAVEALGRVNVLCFDKTGTLTKGRIRLRRVSDGTTNAEPDALTPALRRVLLRAVQANPTAVDDGAVVNETDRAVAQAAARAGVDVGGWTPVAELPFEPSRGFLAVLGADADGRTIAVKGSPEAVLARCALTDAARTAVEAEFEHLVSTGARVLAVAVRPAGAEQELSEDAVTGLELAGFLAFSEQVRGSAALAVTELAEAGVEVVMITGDHPATATSIARELGILDGGMVVTGAELDALDNDELTAVLPRVSVFARTTPAQKVRIVRGLQALGRTVAMTGDGANDAAPIRLADCGIAVGKRSAPAARDAADIVVTTNRIETIVAAIVEGRAMWGSVRDALGILVGGNLGEIGFSVAGSLLGGAPALNARQLLLVNLMTDLAPAVVIAVRPPRDVTSEALLHAGPEASLGGQLSRAIAIRAVSTGAGASGAYLAARVSGSPARARTVGLVALVGTQLGQTLVAGRGSRLVTVTGLGSIAVLAGIVQTPGLSHFFGCRPLGPAGWATAVTAAALATGGSSLASAVLDRPARPSPTGQPTRGLTDLTPSDSPSGSIAPVSP